jgi:hypothetical protein
MRIPFDWRKAAVLDGHAGASETDSTQRNRLP